MKAGLGVWIPNTLSRFDTVSISIVRSVLEPRRGTQGHPVSSPEAINKVISEVSQSLTGEGIRAPFSPTSQPGRSTVAESLLPLPRPQLSYES